MGVRATFNAIVGNLEYPMFIVTAPPAPAELFGGETGDEVDKFARCDWHDGPQGPWRRAPASRPSSASTAPSGSRPGTRPERRRV